MFPVLLVQCLLKNAHPGRHQQSECQHGNACKNQIISSKKGLGKGESIVNDKEELKRLVQIMTTNRRAVGLGLLMNNAC